MKMSIMWTISTRNKWYDIKYESQELECEKAWNIHPRLLGSWEVKIALQKL